MSSQVTLFRKLPVELRQQIFDLALVPLPASEPHHETIAQKIPGLIKALRPEADLYHEALHVFYKYNRFYFTTHNFEAFSKDNAKFTYLQHLGVDLASPYDEKFIEFTKLADKFLSTTSKLKSMHINLHEHRGGFKNIASLIWRLRTYSGNLRSLTLNVTLEGTGLWIQPGQEQNVYTSHRKLRVYRERRAKIDELVGEVVNAINPLFGEEPQRRFFLINEGTTNVTYKVIERWVWEV